MLNSDSNQDSSSDSTVSEETRSIKATITTAGISIGLGLVATIIEKDSHVTKEIVVKSFQLFLLILFFPFLCSS